MTSNKKILVLMVVLLAAITVTPAMAVGNVVYQGYIYDSNVEIDGNIFGYISPYSEYWDYFDESATFTCYYPDGTTETKLISYSQYGTIAGAFKITYSGYYSIYDGSSDNRMTYHVYNAPAVPTEPPAPEGTYLKATAMSYDVTFITYQISTEPDDQGYEFSRITTTPQDNQFTNPQWSPAHSIIYSIPRGTTITFYSKAKSLLNTELISVSVTAPTGQEDTIINATAPEVNPENTERNPPPIPHVTPGSKDNPINSGKFRPSNSNSNYITPFTQFTTNIKEFMQLPQMESPQKMKSEILNTTGGNLTAPLYESIDGFTNLLCFPAYLVSDSVNAALSPIEDTLNYCDDVLIVIFGSVNEFFLSIDTLKSFFYMLIPDFVWWIICTILIFDIITTIMSFIYGRSITFYYLFGFNEKKD